MKELFLQRETKGNRTVPLNVKSANMQPKLLKTRNGLLEWGTAVCLQPAQTYELLQESIFT